MPDWTRADARGKGRTPYVHADLQRSDRLYRYMDIEGVVATFQSGALRMKAPRRWDDPYERWWCDKLFHPGSKLNDTRPYGLCWTTRNRDEPFWRIYTCPGSTVPAVRIRTSVGTLLDRMADLVNDGSGKAFLGRVRYAKVDDLNVRAEELTRAKQVASSAATGLHWKRSQFILEREVRLLWVMASRTDEPYYSLPFDTEHLIDQVMIGPTTDTKQTALAQRKLLDAGVPERVVCRSLLYAQAT